MRLAGPRPEIGAVDDGACGVRRAGLRPGFTPPPDLHRIIGRGSSTSTAVASWRAISTRMMRSVAPWRATRPARWWRSTTDWPRSIAFRPRWMTRSRRSTTCSTELRSFGLDPRRIAVGGDSAGATLATVCGARAASCEPDHGRRASFCCVPVLEMEPRTVSRRDFGNGYLLDAGLMARDLADYAPLPHDRDDPRLSPLEADIPEGFPPAVIHTAEFDPLRDEGAAYAEKLRRAGVSAEDHCHLGMIHHFYGLTGFIPRARSILTGIAADLGARLRSQPERP